MPNALYDNAITVIRNADMQACAADSLDVLTSKAIEVQKAVTGLRQAQDWPALGSLLRMVRDVSDYGLLPIETFGPDSEACLALDEHAEKIQSAYRDACRLRSEKLLDAALRAKMRHTDRHRLIEKAIRLRLGLSSAAACHNADLAFIARCYLERSRLVLPKGSSLPEKKIEALEKALDYADKSSLAPDDELRIQILLEQLQWDERIDSHDINKTLEQYIHSPGFSKTSSFHVYAAGQARRLGLGNAELDHFILDSPASDSRHDAYALWADLFRCEAALRSRLESVDDHIGALIKKLRRVPFSSPLWDETVQFFEKLHKGSDSIIDLWKMCTEREEQIRLSIQVRWYWARYQKLYDMAFMQAWNNKNYRMAAEIADSLKSRPSLKLLTLEKSLSGKDKELVGKLLDIEATFASGGFSPAYDELIKSLPAMKEKPPARAIDAVPEGWAALHLYVTPDSQCYVIVARSSGVSAGMQTPVGIGALHDVFRAWRALATDQTIKPLCAESGQAFEFLFDLPEKNLLLIPHGFLHMVPLHAMYREGRGYLFEHKQCLYLPAWSLAPAEKTAQPDTEGSLLFKNFEPNDESDKFTSLPGVKSDASFADICADIGSNQKLPRLLGIICHGQGDRTNPYNARLLLADTGATHRELREKLPDISGSKVILSACEGDFTVGGIDLTDEHLSIASAFLYRGASEVVAGLFKVDAGQCFDLINTASQKTSTPLYELVAQKQNEWLRNTPNNIKLKQIAPFRVVGFPQCTVEGA